MARKSVADRDSDVIRNVRKIINASDGSTNGIKQKWRESHDMFVNGTVSVDKQDWQTDFSVNKFQSSIRTAQGRLVNTIVNLPDWYELEPRSYENKQAEVLAPAFMKLMDYYIESSKFKRHAGTFFLCSLISCGHLYVGWKRKLIQNPVYVLEKADKERQREQIRISKKVANPQVEDPVEGQALEEDLLSALDEFMSMAQGVETPKEKTPPYVQVGCLDLKDIIPENAYWDPNCQYMEDSLWRAFKFTVNRWELNKDAQVGIFDKSKVKRIGSRKDMDIRMSTQDARFRSITKTASEKQEMVDLTFYYGPLIEADGQEVLKENYWCIIANDSVVLKEGEYPFWEPPGHHAPMISAAVRQIPFRPTGAGIGDSAMELQKIYDSNWQLICDTFRFGIAGLNVVNYQALVDKSQLLEGVYPGMTLEVRTPPKEAFEHISLTANLENQAHPVQSMLEQAIDQATGINELMQGGSNPFSRTAAAETNARLDAGNQNVNIIALDLETNFLVPSLQKIFARVLQFGLPEVSSNPELQALLNQEEMQAIAQLNAGSRMEILTQWYNFKIKGFSNDQDKNEAKMRDNEFLQIASSNPLISQMVNWPVWLKHYWRNSGHKDTDSLLIDGTPLEQVTAENQVLLSGHSIMPSPNDDHQFHLENQQALAQSPYATPQMQEHIQMHMQYMQQMQMAQQQQEQGGQPPIQ